MRYQQAILASCEVPWDDREELMEDLFRREVRGMLARGINNVYIFGTAGEGYAVDTRKFEQVVRAFCQETGGPDVFPQVGVIGLSTAAIVERIGFAHGLGFRAFQISLPSWGRLNDTELLTFFTDVCGAFPDSKFLHYNLGRAKRELTAADYRRIADTVPNFAATKITSGRVMDAVQLMRQVPDIQHFFGEALFPFGCLYGECSLLASFAAMCPTKTQQYFELGRTGQFGELFPMMRTYMDLISDFIGATAAKELIDGAYDKMIVRMSGLDFPPRLLSPYEWYSEDVFQAIRTTMHEKYSDWLG